METMHWNEDAETEINRRQEDDDRKSLLQEKKEKEGEKEGETSNKERFVATFSSFWD